MDYDERRHNNIYKRIEKIRKIKYRLEKLKKIFNTTSIHNQFHQIYNIHE